MARWWRCFFNWLKECEGNWIVYRFLLMQVCGKFKVLVKWIQLIGQIYATVNTTVDFNSFMAFMSITSPPNTIYEMKSLQYSRLVDRMHPAVQKTRDGWCTIYNAIVVVRQITETPVNQDPDNRGFTVSKAFLLPLKLHFIGAHQNKRLERKIMTKAFQFWMHPC